MHMYDSLLAAGFSKKPVKSDEMPYLMFAATWTARNLHPRPQPTSAPTQNAPPAANFPIFLAFFSFMIEISFYLEQISKHSLSRVHILSPPPPGHR